MDDPHPSSNKMMQLAPDEDPVADPMEEEERIRFAKPGVGKKSAMALALFVAVTAVFARHGVMCLALVCTIQALCVIYNFVFIFAARLAGLHEIKEFGIGVGPAVAWWRVRGVLCTIRLFPLGGFVRFPGQDASGAPIGFRALGPWKKAAIALSAPATFVLMGWMVSVAFHRADDPLRAFNWLFSQDALSFRNWRGMFLQAISGIHSQTDFLRAAGVIVLGVGILNLLPIPSVSGGQALMYLMMARVEQRKALRMESFLQMIGILILLAIAVFTWSALAGALFF